MTDLFYQGKLIRQFWGKIIRQSTKKGDFFDEKNTCEHMSGGGAVFKNLKKIIFVNDT